MTLTLIGPKLPLSTPTSTDRELQAHHFPSCQQTPPHDSIERPKVLPHAYRILSPDPVSVPLPRPWRDSQFPAAPTAEPLHLQRHYPPTPPPMYTLLTADSRRNPLRSPKRCLHARRQGQYCHRISPDNMRLFLPRPVHLPLRGHHRRPAPAAWRRRRRQD